MIIKELKFPTVYDQGKAAGYGGDQEWFSLFLQRKAGCGCTSGANLAVYYASARPEMAGIYDGNCELFDRKDYVKAMEKMYSYMTPGIVGFPYVKKFACQFIKFCKDHGVEAEAEFCNKFAKKEEAVRFIQESIDRGDPVAILILFHRAKSLKEDNWHWATITGYTDDENCPEENEIILSNCGERQVLKADDLFEVHRRNILRMVRFKIL